MSFHSSTPAESLVGLRLNDRWNVESKVRSDTHATGGHFSTSYLAEDDQGNRVFVKALDFSGALHDHDPAAALNRLTEAFVFERDLVRKCGDRGLGRIVRALDDGRVHEPGWPVPVQYLVFERADEGDVRSFVASMHQLDLAFALRALHHVAVGLSQLHSIDVAHQDLKPSNVLVFDDRSAEKAKKSSKIGDLGRSSTKERRAAWDALTVAGDRNYCPPEQMYGYASLSWDRHRRATDLYHLGSLIMFFFTGASTTQSLVTHLDTAHLPYAWEGPYEQVLPYVAAAFDATVDTLRDALPASVVDDLTPLFIYLCHPDLDERGHPRNRAGVGSQYELRRFVSAFNQLAYRAERDLLEVQR